MFLESENNFLNYFHLTRFKNGSVLFALLKLLFTMIVIDCGESLLEVMNKATWASTNPTGICLF